MRDPPSLLTNKAGHTQTEGEEEEREQEMDAMRGGGEGAELLSGAHPPIFAE